MANELLMLLWRATVAASLAAIVVMVVRVPLRRACGCGIAYAAWLAVPLTALASSLPAPAFQVPTLGVAPLTLFTASTIPTIAAKSAMWPWQNSAVLLWALGAVGMALRQVRAQRAYMRSLGPLTFGDGVAVSRSLLVGPCLVGMLKPLIAVPSDFEQRYSPIERQLILAHEEAHATANDPLINLLCAVLVCVWWFNPLMHLALRLQREDQELARDADVMRAFPGTRRAYADAMLKTQMTSSIHAPIVCRWEPKHPLKERIMSLSRRPSNVARHAGRLTLSVGLLCGAYAAWAEQGPAGGIPPDGEGTTQTAVVTSPTHDFSDWVNARPSSVVTVTAGPKPGQFFVKARITDLETSKVLSEPRLLTVAGVPATVEVGNDDLLVRLVVTVNPSGKEAAYTNEVRRHGQIESSQSAILVVNPSGISQATTAPASDAKPTPTSEANRIGAPDGKQYEFKLTFSSTDQAELSCVADVLAADGRIERQIARNRMLS